MTARPDGARRQFRATGPKYADLYHNLTAEQLRAAAWADQEFLISTSMAIVGVFTLLPWDALFRAGAIA